MLTVARNGRAVEIKATVNVPSTSGYIYTFKCDVGGEDWAGFLMGAVDKMIDDHLRCERQKYYEEGWKAARSHHKTKRTWFPHLWLG